jgi:hypothetical protein
VRQCPSREVPFVVQVDEPKGRLEKFHRTERTMFHPLSSYQLYRYEHGLSAAGQRAADVCAGEAAAALRDLRLCLGRAFRPGHRVRPTRGPAGAVTGSGATAPARVLSGVR